MERQHSYLLKTNPISKELLMGIIFTVTAPTINIKEGDIIILRNGEEHQVTAIKVDASDLEQHVRVHFNNTQYWYTNNGYYNTDESEDDLDIVKVIKHTDLGVS